MRICSPLASASASAPCLYIYKIEYLILHGFVCRVKIHERLFSN